MSKFILPKVISLDRFGESWKGAYITFTAPTWAESVAFNKKAETADAIEELNKFLSTHFIGGKAPSEGSLVELKVTDIQELPAEVISAVAQELGGGALPPNA